MHDRHYFRSAKERLFAERTATTVHPARSGWLTRRQLLTTTLATAPGSAVVIDPTTGLPMDPYAGIATTSDPAAEPAPAAVSPIDVAR